jgi:hypothetical protein
MKKYISLTVLLFIGSFLFPACEKADAALQCQAITLNKPFTAKIGEEWCIPASAWKISFGPFVEDSRCNVADIECVWAGRFVLAATIDNGDAVQDTFYAVENWMDTLLSGPYTIILHKVLPETRLVWEDLDPGEYSFQMIVK